MKHFLFGSILLSVFLYSGASDAAEKDPLWSMLSDEVLYQVVEETQRRTELPGEYQRGGPLPAATQRRLAFRRACFGFRVGGFFVTDAYGEEPDPDFALGILFRTPLGPRPAGRLEVAFDTNLYKMKYDAGGTVDEVYHEYYEFSVSFIGYFPNRSDYRNAYWGAGLGYSKETLVAVIGGTKSEGDEDSTVFIIRLGWDTLEGVFFEASYRWLMNDDSYIDALLYVSIGFYF